MSLSLAHFLHLIVQRVDSVRQPTPRDHPPALGRAPFDLVAHAVSDAFVRSGGWDRFVTSKLVHRARRSDKATANGLSASPASAASLCFGYRDDSSPVDDWGGAADLAESASPPVFPHRRCRPGSCGCAAAPKSTGSSLAMDRYCRRPQRGSIDSGRLAPGPRRLGSSALQTAKFRRGGGATAAVSSASSITSFSEDKRPIAVASVTS